MQRKIPRRLALSYLGLGSLALVKPGEAPAFPNWSPAYVDRILTDSPWARPSTVSFELSDERHFRSNSFHQISLPGLGGSRSSSSVRTEIFLTTRWASALPVRQAMALSQFGQSGLASKRALELLNRIESDYVIEIAGFPATLIRQGAERFEAELRKTSTLTGLSDLPVAPVSVNVPPHGMHLMATLRFPRLNEQTTKDGWIELNAVSGALKIRERFKLKQMFYAGRLEL